MCHELSRWWMEKRRINSCISVMICWRHLKNKLRLDQLKRYSLLFLFSQDTRTSRWYVRCSWYRSGPDATTAGTYVTSHRKSRWKRKRVTRPRAFLLLSLETVHYQHILCRILCPHATGALWFGRPRLKKYWTKTCTRTYWPDWTPVPMVTDRPHHRFPALESKTSTWAIEKETPWMVLYPKDTTTFCPFVINIWKVRRNRVTSHTGFRRKTRPEWWGHLGDSRPVKTIWLQVLPPVTSLGNHQTLLLMKRMSNWNFLTPVRQKIKKIINI